jgi:hypothetical protein
MSNGYFGTYRGIVTNNKDPENHRRVKVTIPQLVKQDPGKSISAWIWPQENASIKSEVPGIGDGVWITFEGGDPNYPVWTGVFGKNQQKNKHLFFKPLKNTITITDIVDVLKINKRQDGTSEVDVLDTLLNLSNQHFYGAFYSTQTQNGGGGYPISLNQTVSSKGVSITSNSRITFAYPGIYNIQFSCQLEKTDSGKDSAEIWLRKNGADVPWSNTIVELDGNNAKSVAAWNFVEQITAAGHYLELMWYSSDANSRLYAQTASARPGIPSVILTVTQVR